MWEEGVLELLSLLLLRVIDLCGFEFYYVYREELMYVCCISQTLMHNFISYYEYCCILKYSLSIKKQIQTFHFFFCEMYINTIFNVKHQLAEK